jgi:hypothetical protein
LLANYLCNEGTGTTLTDTSGNNNHGTITGATWAVKKAGTTKAAPTKANKNWVKPLSSGYGISGTNPVFPSNYTVTHTAIGQYKGLSKAFTNDEVAYLRGKTVTFGAEYLTGTDSNHIVQLNVTTPAGNAYIGGHYTPAAGYRTYTLPLDLTGLGFSIQVQIVGDGSITYECRNPFLVVGSSYDGVFEAYRSVSDVKSASLTLTVVR